MVTDTNKYSKWVFTLNQGGEDNSLPSAKLLKQALEQISDKFVFQLERGEETGRLHYQGCFITRIRKRHKTVLYGLGVDLQIEINQLTVNRMAGTWEQAEEYCSKGETKVDDQLHMSSQMEKAELEKYKGEDLEVFQKKGFFPWQSSINDIVFETGTYNIKTSSCREVVWVEDLEGNTGKSLFTKYLCWHNDGITKLAFGSGSQMRASIVEEGAKRCYIIDIPRKLCNDDFQNNIYSVIEDLKNGFVKSSMYGKPKTLFMLPPIVIIFSNESCPTEKLSLDRWKKYSIIENKLLSLNTQPLDSLEGMV